MSDELERPAKWNRTSTVLASAWLRLAMRHDAGGIVRKRGLIETHEGESVAAGWQVRSMLELAEELLGQAGATLRIPRIVAVDGRSGSGKSTFAARLSAVVPDSAVVHSDDIAWWESFFDWEHLLVQGVLEPVRRGTAVRYRPPAWEQRGRPGAIEVPAGARTIVIEGVGVSRHSLAPWLDATVWVQSDLHEARRRGVDRDGGTESAALFWEEWERAELAFLAADRPWERAQLVVCGTPALTGIPHDPSTEVLVGRST